VEIQISGFQHTKNELENIFFENVNVYQNKNSNKQFLIYLNICTKDN
jgi:hypothetical protein